VQAVEHVAVGQRALDRERADREAEEARVARARVARVDQLGSLACAATGTSWSRCRLAAPPA
jgi:hypothetical protein